MNRSAAAFPAGLGASNAVKTCSLFKPAFMKAPLKILYRFAFVLVLLGASLVAKADGSAAASNSEAKSPFEWEGKNLPSVNELDTPPVLITGKPPQYPRALRKSGVAGVVVVEFIVDRSGDVIQMQVVESTRVEFELPALESVKTWKFKPPMKDKSAVKVRMTERLEFEAPKK